jgi:hypothetical protein
MVLPKPTLLDSTDMACGEIKKLCWHSCTKDNMWYNIAFMYTHARDRGLLEGLTLPEFVNRELNHYGFIQKPVHLLHCAGFNTDSMPKRPEAPVVDNNGGGLQFVNIIEPEAAKNSVSVGSGSGSGGSGSGGLGSEGSVSVGSGSGGSGGGGSGGGGSGCGGSGDGGLDDESSDDESSDNESSDVSLENVDWESDMWNYSSDDESSDEILAVNDESSDDESSDGERLQGTA